MHPERKGGTESLKDVQAHLLLDKRKALDRLFVLEFDSRAQGGDIIDARRREIGRLRQELAPEVGGADALDRLVKEAYGAHIAEGERARRAREAYRATRKAA